MITSLLPLYKPSSCSKPSILNEYSRLQVSKTNRKICKHTKPIEDLRQLAEVYEIGKHENNFDIEKKYYA